MLTDRDIARWRLHAQRLTGVTWPDARAAVEGLLAVQAESPAQSAWAVACRTATPERADLRAALESGEILRTHVLRPTWHYVGRDDVDWLLELTGPRIRPSVLRQLAQDHGVQGEALDRLRDVVLSALGATPALTRDELATRLAEDAGEDRRHVLTGVLGLLELDRLVCSGPPRDDAHTYALYADRVPAPPSPPSSDEALARLALRYLSGHGPATEKDLAYWATLPLRDVRTGLAGIRGEVDSFEHQGRTFWHAAGSEPPAGPQTPTGHLLQILDEVYRGYQDSRMVLDAAGVVPAGREAAIGMALVDGQMVARMKRVLGREVVFTLQPYRDALGPAERRALESAAARCGAFLGLEHRVVHG